MEDAMSSSAAVKPSRQQLALIDSLEPRAREASEEIDRVIASLEELKAAGIATAGRVLKRLEDTHGDPEWLDVLLEDLWELRASGGNEAAFDWLFYRVNHCSTIGRALAGGLGLATSDRIIQVEKAIQAVDPELIRILDRADSRFYIHDDDEYAAKAGMTREEVRNRAAAAIARAYAESVA
jgi:hypothetical protein